MSTMTDGKNPLQGVIGSTGDLERMLTEKVATARDFLRVSEEMLRVLRGDRPAQNLDPNRYRGMKPEPAMKAFFNSPRARAMTKEELIDELATGNIKTGAANETIDTRRVNAKRSIEAQLGKKKSEYRKVGDKIGPRDWPDEKFVV
jgi:hypothetical protein